MFIFFLSLEGVEVERAIGSPVEIALQIRDKGVVTAIGMERIPSRNEGGKPEMMEKGGEVAVLEGEKKEILGKRGKQERKGQKSNGRGARKAFRGRGRR